MDKYEYNLKLEEIDKLVDQGDYEAAAKMADTIEWRRVRNVRTLCLISEIYEAAGDLEKSREMLERAYRKSPVGRTVLYRLVEVTTRLGQFDEALEYYSEYVQTAPHDNNRYILKYMIYKGRGSSPEELIGILEEYLGLEYTERWAYELASLYQQAGQIQKCLAACDDLVLWFHSGKYVKKALELKKRYATLTPKQQQIYEVCLQDDAQKEYLEDEEEEGTVVQETQEADDEVVAENILAETEKEIAGEIAARKARMEKENDTDQPKKSALGNLAARMHRKSDTDEQEGSETRIPEIRKPEISEQEEHSDLNVELAKSMRRVVAGVSRNPEPNEEDIPAVVEEQLHRIQATPAPAEPARTAGRLSIDDILLAMGEKGKQTAQEARARREEEAAERSSLEDAAKEASADDVLEKEIQTEDALTSGIQAEGTPAARIQTEGTPGSEIQTEEAPAAGIQTEEIPASGIQMEETPAAKIQAEEAPAAGIQTERTPAAEPQTDDTQAEDAQTVAAPAADVQDDGMQGTAAAREGSSSSYASRSITAAAARELTPEQLEALRYSSNPEKFLKNRNSLPSYAAEDLSMTRRIVNTKEELEEAARKEMMASKTIRIPAEEVAKAYARSSVGRQDTAGEADRDETAAAMESADAAEKSTERTGLPYGENGFSEAYDLDDAVQTLDEMPGEETYDDGEFFDDPLTIEPHLRGLFKGFTEIEGVEDQIANAIIQALSKGEDRTSRTGNILIFGPHSSGKTTLAIGLAKAIAQEKGRKVAKMARIYGADLNRKDIAATIAKIAGGTLIVEEAGDLDDKTVEQLTTAMEFRTDGLIVILEDEQRYVHDLLMKHPRFTMKFTAQVYLPEYTADELCIFAQQHANELDYMISEEGFDSIHQKIAAMAETETPMSVGDTLALVDKAIRHSNKFMRKMSMGKKRYDPNDYVLLFAKDFK